MWASSTPCKTVIWSCQFKWSQRREQSPLRSVHTSEGSQQGCASIARCSTRLPGQITSLSPSLVICLKWLANHSFFHYLDIYSGYQHSPIHEGNRVKLPSPIPNGTLRLSANVIWSLQRTCFISEVYDGDFLRPNREHHERFLSLWQYLEMLV